MKPYIPLTLGGVTAGFLAGYLVCRRLLQGQLDAEVQAVKDHYDGRYQKLIESNISLKKRIQILKIELGDDENVEVETDPPKLRIVTQTQAEAEAGLTEIYDQVAQGYPVVPSMLAESELEEQQLIDENERAERDTSKPYVISAAEFEEREDHRKLSISFYAQDEVLVDDSEAPINDTVGTIGIIKGYIRSKFGVLSGDPNLFYVRNERLSVDFEIALDPGSYTDKVLGYGNPARVIEKQRPD